MYALLDASTAAAASGSSLPPSASSSAAGSTRNTSQRSREKLAAQGLLAGTEHERAAQAEPAARAALEAPGHRPRMTRRLTAPFTFLFRPFLWPVLAGFPASSGSSSSTRASRRPRAQAFDNPELLLLVFAGRRFRRLPRARARVGLPLRRRHARRYGNGHLPRVAGFYTDSPTPTACRGATGCATTSAASTSTRSSRSHPGRLAARGASTRCCCSSPAAARDGQAALAGDPRRRLPHPLRHHRHPRPLLAPGPDAQATAAGFTAAGPPRSRVVRGWWSPPGS